MRGVGGERRNHGRRYYVYVRGGCLWARIPGDHVSRLLLLDPSGGSAERIRGATVLVLGVGGPGGSGREYVAELHFVGLSKPVIGGEPGYIASVETAAVVRGARGGGGRSVTLVALGCGIPGLVPLADEHRHGDGGEDADDDHGPYPISLPIYKTRASYDSAPGWAKDPRAEADASVGTKRRSS